MNVSSFLNPGALLGTESAHIHTELLLREVYFYVMADTINISKGSHITRTAESLGSYMAKMKATKSTFSFV